MATTLQTETSEFPGLERNARESLLKKAVVELNPSIGPFELDGWTCITDRAGFLAIRGINLSHISTPPRSEQHAKASRVLLALKANSRIYLGPLREFLAERVSREREYGSIECSIFGRVVDARKLKQWTDVLPFDECLVSATHAVTIQKEAGESLVFTGNDWIFLLAGLMPSLKFPPTYDTEGRNV